MTHNPLLIGLLMAVMLVQISCSEKTAPVSKSPDGHIIVNEVRKLGAGPAPDSVKSYLMAVDAASQGDTEPIFEGQDVGRICYSWLTPTKLNVRISGGYVDRIASEWQDSDGRRVTIRYVGTSGCIWHGAN